MANIQERRDKSGKLISYSIRVHRGRDMEGKQLKPWTATFDVSPTWTEKSAKKKAEAFAANFEKECRMGVTTDTRLKFQEYCEYAINLKEKRGIKHSTIVRYRELTTRIYPAIGHIKLKDLRADHLNDFYTKLGEPGSGKGAAWATAKTDLAALLQDQGLTRTALAKQSSLSLRTIYSAVNGERIREEAAQAIAHTLQKNVSTLFKIQNEVKTLSVKTVLEHHRLISTVLAQAVKESLIPFNVAAKATLPKASRKAVNYFQPAEIIAIRDALEDAPLKWKTLAHLLLITGARRGEILGLKWDKVDFEKSGIHICNNVLYAADIGTYEDTPKTDKSQRFITVPRETMVLLRKYKLWQTSERLRLGEYYENQNFVFTQDNGKPMHPDSVNDWLTKFSKKNNLPHINPHAFRHTMVSLLYFNGMDDVSVSNRLGHAQVSTTANYYAHMIEEADQRNADILAEAILKKG